MLKIASYTSGKDYVSFDSTSNYFRDALRFEKKKLPNTKPIHGSKNLQKFCDDLIHPSDERTSHNVIDMQLVYRSRWEEVLEILVKNSKLFQEIVLVKKVELNLWTTKIGDTGAQDIAKTLLHYKFTKLSITLDNITYTGAKAIAESLKHENCELTELNLHANIISDEGAKYIAEALKDPNCKLTWLNLSKNNIGDQGAKAIAKALKDPNCTLTKLDLSNNNIDVEGAKDIAEALKDPNYKLTELNLRYNNIDVKGAKAIASALTHQSCKLKTLDLYCSNIDLEGAEAIAEALKDPQCSIEKVIADHEMFTEAIKVRKYNAAKVGTTLDVASVGQNMQSLSLVH